jgi:hypothetical protein
MKPLASSPLKQESGDTGSVRDEWQPIETAPKDGSAVLLWNGQYVNLAYWNPAYESKWDHELDKPVVRGAWTDDTVKSFAYEEINEIEGPTHWMPLPAPPSGERPLTPSEPASERRGHSASRLARAGRPMEMVRLRAYRAGSLR